MHRKYEKGWLDRQFRLARETFESLPKWLQEELDLELCRYYYIEQNDERYENRYYAIIDRRMLVVKIT